MPETPLLNWFPVEEKASRCRICGLPDVIYWKVPLVTAALPSHWSCYQNKVEEKR